MPCNPKIGYPREGVNWVLKVFLSKMTKLKFYAQNMQMDKFFKCMLMIYNKYKKGRDREKQTQEFVIEVRLIVYIPALSATT